MKTLSPLRYPGGKASLANYLKHLIEVNVEDCSYFELYAGGAGAALDLLFSNSVRRIILNDADIHIFSFWDSILHKPDDFCKMISDIPIDMDSWRYQRSIYNDNPANYSSLELGFAAFFLNRCNRSGIIKKAGPIGGMNQRGNYLLGCRFNKLDLIRRIDRVAKNADRIEIHHTDTLRFINDNLARLSDEHAFMYLDPPYYKKGKSLYLNAYEPDDHIRLRDLMNSIRSLKWMISYDNAPEIIQLYKSFNNTEHELSYSLQLKRKTKEFFVFSDSIKLDINTF